MPAGPGSPVDAQYGRGDVSGRIEAAIRAAGKDPGHLTLDDLAPLDEFHVGGRRASVELAELAAFEPGSRVLDVGAGLGGPARLLAARFGCVVTALEPVEAYCQAAGILNRATGLSDRVAVKRSSAPDLSFGDGEFDGVWTQHASMNIADKSRLYTEIRRVIRLGGTFALHDVDAGPVQPIVFPVPWADDDSMSFLVTPEEKRSLVESAGFSLISWRDKTDDAVAFFRAWAATGSLPVLGVQVYVPDLAIKSRNQIHNFETNRLRVSQGVFRAL
jgi:MPBQ/MSBQ methyltransferase